MTGSRRLRLGEAMSILARRTRVPSGNSPFLMRSKRSRFSVDAAVAVGAVFAGLGEGAAILANLLGGEVIDVCLAGLDKLHRPCEELIEVVGGVTETIPLEAKPAHIFLDGVHVLLLFLLGIGVVKAQVGEAAELVGQSEVEADGLGVADVQVSVGLRRKARLNDGVAELPGLQILDEDVANEVGGASGGLSRGSCSSFSFRIRCHDLHSFA